MAIGDAGMVYKMGVSDGATCTLHSEGVGVEGKDYVVAEALLCTVSIARHHASTSRNVAGAELLSKS